MPLKSLRPRLKFLALIISPLALVAGIYFFTKPNPDQKPPWSEFRIQIFDLPKSLRPQDIRSSSGQYVYQQLACPLLTWKAQDPSPHMASDCRYQAPDQVICQLRSHLKWSDGSPITAQDYELAFKSYINPESQFFRTDLLLPIKNAKYILKGSMSPTTLGVTATSELTLMFELEEPYREFLHHLANPILSLYKDTLSCGPFFIEQKLSHGLLLAPNPFWFAPLPDKEVKLHFKVYHDDNIGLKAFEESRLDLLRRLPTALLPQLKTRDSYFALDVLRMDAIYIHHDFQNLISLAPRLAQAIDYQKWQALYHAHSPPGCFGLPTGHSIKPVCLTQELTTNPSGDILDLPRVSLFYSKAGGIDHDRAMQFLVHQWSSKLSLEVQPEPLENTYFQSLARDGKLGLFRKGFSLERPTCLAALEGFTSSHIQNPIKFSNSDFDQLIKQMRNTDPMTPKYEALCTQAATHLLKWGHMIPTGPIYFSFLIHPKWKGWRFNSLNHLDLSQLRFEH